MPWRERSAMDEKASFILEWESGEHTFKALCKSYGVSRTLGYRLVAALSASRCGRTSGALASSPSGVESHGTAGRDCHRGALLGADWVHQEAVPMASFDYAVPVAELARGHCLAVANARRLILDGELLLNSGSFLSAISQFRLAVEELAKAHLITNASVFKTTDTEKWKWFWSAFDNHREKLRIIEYEFHWEHYRDRDEFNRRISVLRSSREKLSMSILTDQRRRSLTLSSISQTQARWLSLIINMSSRYLLCSPWPGCLLRILWKMYTIETIDSSTVWLVQTRLCKNRQTAFRHRR